MLTGLSAIGILGVILAGCRFVPPGWPLDYSPTTTVYDAKSGYYVELAEINSLSTFGYQVNVFADANTRSDRSTLLATPIEVTGISTEYSDFRLSEGCYALSVQSRMGGLTSPVWISPDGKTSICFRLVTPQ